MHPLWQVNKSLNSDYLTLDHWEGILWEWTLLYDWQANLPLHRYVGSLSRLKRIMSTKYFQVLEIGPLEPGGRVWQLPQQYLRNSLLSATVCHTNNADIYVNLPYQNFRASNSPVRQAGFLVKHQISLHHWVRYLKKKYFKIFILFSTTHMHGFVFDRFLKRLSFEW